MLTGKTPAAWRKGYSLCRRRLVTDRYGESVPVYDYENPDCTVPDGDAEGVSFQSVQAWQSSGKTSGGTNRLSSGEQPAGAVQAVYWGKAELAPYDRLLALDGCYEVKSVQRWPSYRLLLLDRLW